MITSRDNDTLKLVRKLLGAPKHREQTGLFAVEGEDLLAAADACFIEPVHRLVADETVASELMASVSSLPHPARAIGVYRAADLPRGTRDVCLALWHLADPKVQIASLPGLEGIFTFLVFATFVEQSSIAQRFRCSLCQSSSNSIFLNTLANQLQCSA